MASWHAKNLYGYLKTSTEAKENAEMCYATLSSLGYCLESVCAVLGNQGGESEYNPWRWEGDNPLASNDPLIDTSTVHGYGLVQFTPSGKYLHNSYAQSLTNYDPHYSNVQGSPHDGDAQLRYMHHICSDPSGGEWLPDSSYAAGLGMPYADFIVNSRNYTVEQLTRTFFGCYERGTWSVGDRANTGRYWYEYLSGITPPPPPPPPPTPRRKLPIIFYLRNPI